MTPTDFQRSHEKIENPAAEKAYVAALKSANEVRDIALRPTREAPDSTRESATPAEDSLCWLIPLHEAPQEQAVPPDIAALAAARWAARQRRDIKESDRLRDWLASRGWTVRDRKDGYDLVHS